MKKIIIDPKNAGSGAQTAGRKIWLNDITDQKTSANKTFVKNYYGMYIIQELIHNFKNKGSFRDSVIDQAALMVLDEIDPKTAAIKRQEQNKKGYANGTIAHQLSRDHCRYTQKEIDEDGKNP